MTTSIQGSRLDLTDDARRQVAAALAAALRPLGAGTSAVDADVEQTPAGYRAEVTLSLGRATLGAQATADAPVARRRAPGARRRPRRGGVGRPPTARCVRCPPGG